MSAAGTLAPPERGTLVYVDPSILKFNNIRTTDTDPPDWLVESVGDLGLEQAVTATGIVDIVDGEPVLRSELTVRHGERRTHAAVRAGLPEIPVIVYSPPALRFGDDSAAEVDRIKRQWAENEHRGGLSTRDKIGAVQGLLDFGLTENEAVEALKAPEPDVRAAARAARSDLAKAAASRWDFLTLEQSSAIAEVDDDPEAVKRLMVAAKQGDGTFRHALQRERDEREYRAAHAASEAAKQAALAEAIAALEAEGITVADAGPSRQQRLDQFAGPDGGDMTPEAHRSCPGHSAWLEHGWEPPERGDGEEDEDQDDEDYGGFETEAEAFAAGYRHAFEPRFFCADPAAHGHKPRYTQYTAPQQPRQPQPAVTPEEAAAESAKRSLVLKNNKAWRSAETVRRKWLADFLAGTKLPAGAMTYVAAELAYGDHALRRAMEGGHELAATLLKIPAPEGVNWSDRHGVGAAVSKETDKRAPMMGLAIVLAAVEAATDVHTWRNPGAQDRRYFAVLGKWGYTLSEVEQIVLAPAKS